MTRCLLTWAAPEYYFFAKRRFGAGHALFLPPDAFATPHDQDRMLARMRGQRLPIVLINETRRKEFADTTGEVDRYLQQEYVAAGHFPIREGSEVTIAVRRDLKPARVYGAERWPCGFDSRAASRTASTMLDGSATSLARDVERRAVIDRRPDDGQAERHVDRAAEGEQLHRNQSLVVVAGNDGVEFAARGASEDRVAGKRAVDDGATRARACLDGRPQDVGLFRSEKAFLAGVRVEARRARAAGARCRSAAARARSAR